MAQVPGSFLPSVAPQANSGITYQNANGATPDAFGANIGAAEQGTAKAIEGVGDVLAKHAIKLQDDVNTAQAQDLFLKGDIALSNLTEQFNTLQGADRAAALPKFMEDATKLRTDSRAAAPNSDVAKKFDEMFVRQLGYSIKDAGRNSATAMRQYNKGMSQAIVAREIQAVAKAPDDDKEFMDRVQVAVTTAQAAEDYKGASPEEQENRKLEIVSGMVSTRIQSISTKDPLRARDILKANKDSLTADSFNKLEVAVNESIINRDSRVASDNILQSGALVGGDLKASIKKFEGYRQDPYSDYKQTSSGYGTKYDPQDANLNPEQLKAVHEARLDTELAKAARIVDDFQPGLPKGTRDALISLTYNAGSAWTKNGLGQQIKAGDFEGAKQTFVQYNKAGGETNDALVRRRAAEVTQWGQGDVVMPERTLDVAMERAKERAAQVFPDDPTNQSKYLDTLQNRLRSDYSVMTTQVRESQLTLRNAVHSELFNRDKPPTSYDMLSPNAQAAFDKMQPIQQENIRKQFERNAKADVPYTVERRNLGTQLYGMASLEPDKFMALDISSLDLTNVQKQEFQKKQIDRKALLAKGESINSALRLMGGELNAVGIMQSKTDTGQQERYNQFAGAYQNALDQAQQAKQGPLNDKEKQEIGRAQLRELVLSPGMLWDTKKRAFEIKPEDVTITVTSRAEAEKLAPGTAFKTPDGRILTR